MPNKIYILLANWLAGKKWFTNGLLLMMILMRLLASTVDTWNTLINLLQWLFLMILIRKLQLQVTNESYFWYPSNLVEMFSLFYLFFKWFSLAYLITCYGNRTLDMYFGPLNHIYHVDFLRHYSVKWELKGLKEAFCNLWSIGNKILGFGL